MAAARFELFMRCHPEEAESFAMRRAFEGPMDFGRWRRTNPARFAGALR
jgi:hypothetical protein